MSVVDSGPVRLGLIGLGRIAFAQHLPALRRVPALRVVALCDTDAQQLRRAAALLPATTTYADYGALLTHPDLEAVGILTPPQSHVEVALAALRAGRHVLVEKPLATSLDDSQRLVDFAAGTPLKVLVGYNTRWHRLVRRAREIIRSGALGKVQAIRSAYTHYQSVRGILPWARFRATFGGLLLSEAPHHLDLWRYLLSREIEQVYVSSRPSPSGDDQTVTMAATLAGGVLATAVLLAETSPDNVLDVYGDQGRLCVSLYRVDGLQVYAKATYPGEVRDRLRKAAGLLREAPQMLRALRGGGDFTVSFASMWRHFADTIRDDAPAECTLEDGHRALQAALAAVESARLGMPVLLADVPRTLSGLAEKKDGAHVG